MFVDHVKIHIKGGNGGDGAVSFYRAKYITHGGPDGGDGGKGGDIVFVADRNMSTLIDFRYKNKFFALPGENGGKQNRTGKDAEDIIIKVPVGTVVKEAKTGKVMADLAVSGDRKTIIKGGKGGKGNQHFATPSRQAPKYAEKGRSSAEYTVILELKLIADVGLIGFPNVGKSSFLKAATNANPKIASYHFTTLSPNLGVVRSKSGLDFVMADIPGLIEGASEGAGLGHRFLRHIERTKVFIHVVDAAALEGGDPLSDIEKINNELSKYNEALNLRPQIIAANKIDIPEALQNFEKIKEKYGDKAFAASAATNQGIDEILTAVSKILLDYPDTIVFEEDYEEFSEPSSSSEPFIIENPDKGLFIVSGVSVEKMMGYTNLETEKGFDFFQKYLREKGIIEALEEKNIQEGDTVKIYDVEFEYYK